MKGFFLVQVRGESMWPDLVPGKRYIATSFLRPKEGDIVVARDPSSGRMVVKYLTKKEGNKVFLSGTVSWAETVSGEMSDMAGMLIAPFLRNRLLFRKRQ